MRGITWFRLRIAIIAATAATVLLVPAEPYVEMRTLPSEMILLLAVFAVASLVTIPFLLLVVVGFQAINPFSDQEWSTPSHDANPFYLRNPLFFFHFAAYVTLATGASLVLSSIWRGWFALAHGVLMLLAAPMTLAGVHLCIRVFRHKVPESPTERGQ